MNRLFGATNQKPQQQPTQPTVPVKQAPVGQPTTLDLSEQSKRMEAKTKELSEIITNLEKEVADLYKKTKASKGSTAQMYKQRCMMALKKKKMYQDQLDVYMNQQFSLDQIAFTKENIQNTIETANIMKQATQVQKQMMDQIDLDEIADLRDDMDDMNWQQQQINETLNRNYAVDADEFDLDQEMKELDDDLFRDVLNDKSAGNKDQVPAYFQSFNQKNMFSDKI